MVQRKIGVAKRHAQIKNHSASLRSQRRAIRPDRQEQLRARHELALATAPESADEY